MSAYDVWSARQSLNDTFVSTTHTAPYPIPTSYPAFFKDSEATPTSSQIHPGTQSAVFSSLSTGSRTALLFSAHASAIDAYLKKKPDAEALGFDGDELKELVNDLWTLYDSFGGGEED
ncbi:hypothetical protein C0991_009321, partial [Blastosporella zonata]